MKRYALEISYCGARYGGWQRQNNSITVQQLLEEAAEDLFGAKTSVVASGRTDSGVHARSQICHMDVDTAIPARKIAAALNMRLPQDISVLRSAEAPQDFDANRSAKKKTYCYRVYVSEFRRPLLDGFAVQTSPFDFEKLKEALSIFVGQHDFAAYSKSGSTAKTTVRTVYSAEASQTDAGCPLIGIYVTGGGFLYNMVRTIAGTAIDCARGLIAKERISQSLSSPDRALVGKTMPAKGLTLEGVNYGFDPFS